VGKIHEALEKAEQQRSRRSGGAQAPQAPAEVVGGAPKRRLNLRLRRRGSSSKQQRGSQVRESRRARVVLTDGSALATEQFRSLRARITSLRRTRPIRTIVVTSALPREGKTNTAVNMALSFGLDLDKTTCLVDADLRTPRVHRALAEPPDAGLAEVLEGDAKLDDVLVRIPDTRLSVLAVRALPPHPAELLGSKRMAQLLEELTSRFDLVIIDSPPIMGLPDTTTLVDLCDATLLVIGAGWSSQEDVTTALERIDGGKVLGVVFNRCDVVRKPYGHEEIES
jgi:non-specific protein-tyrosine kinase